MNIEALTRIVSDQRAELDNKLVSEKLVEREGLGYVKRFLQYPNIVAILGVRRCGKSIFSLLLSRLHEGFAYINFDDERLMGAEASDLNKVLQAFYELYGKVELIILDEVQNVVGWELFASRLRETRKVIITGSNSRLLSGELATHLTGRHIDFTLYPFSFRETLDFSPDVHLTEHRARIRTKLAEYVKGSGFPEFAKFGPNIIAGIYGDIIINDCIRRHGVRNEATFREIARYLVSNSSNEFTYSKLSRMFGLRDVHTVKNYVSYLKEAFLIVILERFSPKLKQQIIAPKKVYAIDHGLCNFVSFRLSENVGKTFENIVCVELFRKKATNPGVEIYYWKNHKGNEVDFVVKEGRSIKQLIQVCYDTSDDKTRGREVKALREASNELKCSNLLVLTGDEEGEEKKGGMRVRYIPLWKWLLL